MKYEFIIEPGMAGKRLDVFLSEQITKLTRSQCKNWIEQGLVHSDGVCIKKAGFILEAGMKVTAIAPETKKLSLTPQKVGIKILFEDDYLAVLNKPTGISVHPSTTESAPTVVHGLLHELKTLSSVGGVERPGIVHRIDKGTSGILVISKTDSAHHHLSAQFKEHSIERRYKALVYGNLSKKTKATREVPEGTPHGTIATPYGRHPVNRKKMTGKTKLHENKKTRNAITHWKVLEQLSEVTLVECKLETGRTHQIRVHLSEFGFPLVGDPLYGSHSRLSKDLKNVPLRKFVSELDHQLLHAYFLEFTHPQSQKRLRFESDLPEDFTQALALAR